MSTFAKRMTPKGGALRDIRVGRVPKDAHPKNGRPS